MIDYERMKKCHPKHKASLTRAKKKEPEAVIKAVDKALAEFDLCGAWPDNWALWRNAKEDAEREIRKRNFLLDN